MSRSESELLLSYGRFLTWLGYAIGAVVTAAVIGLSWPPKWGDYRYWLVLVVFLLPGLFGALVLGLFGNHIIRKETGKKTGTVN